MNALLDFLIGLAFAVLLTAGVLALSFVVALVWRGYGF
jgi:hypothetical protein